MRVRTLCQSTTLALCSADWNWTHREHCQAQQGITGTLELTLLRQGNTFYVSRQYPYIELIFSGVQENWGRNTITSTEDSGDQDSFRMPAQLVETTNTVCSFYLICCEAEQPNSIH